MLKNVLIPEKIGNYFIFTQKILGFEISKTHVKAIKITVLKDRQTVIEKYFEEYIGNSNNNSYLDKATSVIKKIVENNKDYNIIKVSLASYLVIYKELTLPFTDTDKIKSILDFEIESVLPFSIHEAITDFIVTKQDNSKKETTILVAIARKKDIQELIEPFKNAGVQLNKIVVDVIGMYGLIESLIPKEESIALIDIESDFTNIIYIQNDHLKFIRSIHQGYYQKNEFLTNIEFTLNSFKILIPDFTQIQKILLVCKDEQIQNVKEFFINKLNIACDYLTIDSIVKNKNFINKEKNLTDSSLISLAIAYPAIINEDFNLLQKEFEPDQKNLFIKQLSLFAILSLLIIISVITFSQIRLKKLRDELNVSKNEIVNVLKNRFEITDPAILRNLSELINTTNNSVNSQEAVWGALSKKTKFSFLKYLAELSKIIDKQAIGLNLKNLNISQGVITIEGEVKDFKALEIFENELNESKLFSHVSVPQETSFIIKITVKKNED